MAMNNFYYNKQIKKYLVQFMAIFGGLQVSTGEREDGETKKIPVPVHYGSKDRVTASILADNTQNQPIRLPVMSAYLTNIEMAPELRKGIGHNRKTPQMPRGGLFPDDIRIVEQLMPVPYKATAELSIYTSNMDQHFQVMEQILLYFDPTLQIQTDDGSLNWSRITTVELMGIRFDENYPIGTDRRMIVTTLDFTFPIYVAAPSNMKDNFIAEIYARIGAIDSATNIGNSEEVLGDLDGQGIDYENIAGIDGLNIVINFDEF